MQKKDMKIRTVALFALAAATISVAGSAPQSQQDDAAAQWWSHVSFLASDQLAGRRTGTVDFDQAAGYAQAQFKDAGLKPAGVNGFFQEVGFTSVQVDSAATYLEVEHAGQKHPLAIGTDVVPSPRVDSNASVDAPAEFAGYGFAVPRQHYDDLIGLDLKGKIVVVFAGSPASVHGPLRAYYRTAAERWKVLKAAGAIGVITIPDETTARRMRAAEGESRPMIELTDPQLNTLHGLKLNATVKPAVAEIFFAGSGHTLSELRSLASEGKPLPRFPLDITIHAHTAVGQPQQFTSPNVVGLLEGSDRRLKKEYIVLSAHLDHLGSGRPVNGDSIYNGAMDNAAGIASLIEIAKQLSSGPRPKRSILFLALTGEEEGELGSQYFAEFPTVPRRQIVAEFNMDMYLPLFPLRYLEVQGLGESTLGNDVRAVAQLNDIEVQFDKQPDENRFIRSDQASFIKHGIPALAFKFGWIPDSPEQKTFNDWIKNRYHKPSDDTNQSVDKNAAVLFDRILAQLAVRVANAHSSPSWYPESFFASIPRD
jgi:hypothetical protein